MARVRTVVIGTGDMARHHLMCMLGRRDTRIAGCVEVSEASRKATRELFAKRGVAGPPFFGSIGELKRHVRDIDAAFIVTPHKFHYEHATQCLKAGMDVLLEKPMVMNASEARRLIACRDKTGRLLVVGFPGSLSPAVQKARQMIADGMLGRVCSVSAHVHQNWLELTGGTWRQDPEISGGGFLFDTGSHMLNTVVDMIDSDVTQVTALLDNRGTPVEITASVSGRFRNGVLFSLCGAGDSIHCTSQVRVLGDRGILETDVWGGGLRLKRNQDQAFKELPISTRRGVWEQFLKVRAGKLANPCPPEVGLRFAKLMDMIRRSADEGRVVTARQPACGVTP